MVWRTQKQLVVEVQSFCLLTGYCFGMKFENQSQGLICVYIQILQDQPLEEVTILKVVLQFFHFRSQLLKILNFTVRAVLLRYELQAIQFTHVKHTAQWLLMYSQNCAVITIINFRILYHPQKKPCTCQQSFSILLPSSPLPSTGQPLTCFLSLSVCLFWIFHVKRIIHCMVFCDCLLSPNTRFSRFIIVVTGISTSFLFIAE